MMRTPPKSPLFPYTTLFRSDNGTPPLSATNSFTVVVTEVNSAPTLPTQTNHTISEFTALVVTNRATDTDLPANTLSYTLLSQLARAHICTPVTIRLRTPYAP